MRPSLLYSFLLLFLMSTSAHAQVESVWQEVVINLNDGQKWVVHEDMLPLLNTSFELISNSDVQKKGQYQKLAKKLLKLADRLADVCYLEGDGHAYFHAWYVPYYGLLKELRDELFVVDARTIIEDLRRGTRMYHLNFE